MRRAWKLTAVVLALCSATSFAEVAVTGLGMDQEFQFRVGLTQTTTEVGLFGQYVANFTDTEDDERYGGGVYALVKVVGDPNSLLGAFEPLGDIETSLYLLVRGGWMEGNDGILGIGVGSRIGPAILEFEWRPTARLWAALPDTNDDTRFSIGAKYEF